MKTPIPLPIPAPPHHAHQSRLVHLLTALALVCSGSALGPPHDGHEPQPPRIHSEPGAAQSDTTRQLAAKLSSLNGLVRVGVCLFLLGLLSLTYPPLRALVRGLNTRVALLLGGVVLMVLPTLIVGNERLILGALVLGFGAWYFAHRRRHPAGRKL